MSLTEFFDDLNYLSEVDWQVMRSRYWYDTNEDPDRKRRRQAEFLIHHRFPWGLVETIAVLHETVKTEVEKITSVADYQPKVICKSGWYY